MNRQTQRSELQERIAAELKEKSAKAKLLEDAAMNDVEDLAYMEGTKQTTGLAWAWTVIVILALGVIISFFVMGNSQ